MSEKTFMQVKEFEPEGAVVRINSRCLHEHESAVLIREFRSYLQAGERRLVVVDFEPVELISSAALGAMVSINTELAKRGGYLIVVNLNEDAMRIVRMTKLDRLFPVESSVERARERLLRA